MSWKLKLWLGSGMASPLADGLVVVKADARGYSGPMIKVLRAFATPVALLLAGFAPTALAQPAPQAAVQIAPQAAVQIAPQAAVQIAHPALWKISGANATIYLFGTIHLLPADVRWFDGAVAQAFTRSDTLVTEIREPTSASLRPILAAKAMLPEGEMLRDILTPPDRVRLEAALTANHLPVGGFDKFQPWYAAVALATTPMLQMGYDPANGVDNQLGQRAQAQALPHEALETVDFQLGLFAGLPPRMQKAYLMQVIRQLPEVKTELTGIIHAWEIGNAETLAKLMNSKEDDPQMMQILLFDRNLTWAKWIQARLAKPAKPHETVFIAVGAGHLAGPGSVMDQLRALGINSTRLQ